MQILIGCAKDMQAQCEWQVPYQTTPLWQNSANSNARQMAEYSAEELQDMLKISSQLANEVRLRYKTFDNEDAYLAAIQAYNGVVFKHMKASSFTDKDFDFAQKHLWITSFLYGLLRPLDKIKPYRLEGRIVLPQNNCSMFAYWKPLLTDAFIESVKSDDGILIDMASNEMRSFFDWKRVEKEVTVIKPDFLVKKSGQLKSLSVYAKKGRGSMTEMILRKRLQRPEELLSFDGLGFYHAGHDKDERNPIFLTEIQ